MTVEGTETTILIDVNVIEEKMVTEREEVGAEVRAGIERRVRRVVDIQVHPQLQGTGIERGVKKIIKGAVEVDQMREGNTETELV